METRTPPQATPSAGQSQVLDQAVAQVVAALSQTALVLADYLATAPLHPAPAPTGTLMSLGEANASGDVPGTTDLLAEQLFVQALASTPVAAVGSEESVEPILLNDQAPLVVALDPIDGSGNLTCNACVGVVFAVLPRGDLSPQAALLQPGRRILAAGLIVFGPATTMALSLGAGTDLYTAQDGAFVPQVTGQRIARTTTWYAINMANQRHWSDSIRTYVDDLLQGATGPRGRDFNLRWLGCVVAEAYRVLCEGGVYLYPSDERPTYRQGRLRLVYEANPIAFLCEQAGGGATDGTTSILDLVPQSLHQKVPLIFGSAGEVGLVEDYLQQIVLPSAPESPLFARRGLFRD